MTVRRPGPGRQVGHGRLRVDAKRAIAKLRDYQLPDPTLWVLEVIRAAIADGAESVSINGDTNDIWVSWPTTPWPDETTRSLLNELVSPEPARTGQRLRLLATAVNSALGIPAAFVDIYSVEDGEAQRVRYTPHLLVVSDEDELSSLDRIDVVSARPPADSPVRGMVVHLRRKLSLELLEYFVDGPPELRIARRACRDSPVPVRIADVEVGRHAAGDDLFRINLGEDLDGFIALTEPQARPLGLSRSQIDIAEQGVTIASYRIAITAYPVTAPVDVRVYINAERMPTNASRSSVPLDGHPVKAAVKRATELFPALCTELARRISSDAEATGLEALQRAAIRLLASFSTGPGWGSRLGKLPPALAPLGKLPLVANAIGAPSSAGQAWAEKTVHFGRTPFEPELEPWLGNVLWVRPGDRAQLLYGPETAVRPAKALAREGRKRLRARARFMEHRPAEARLPERRDSWLVAPLDTEVAGSCVEQELPEGVIGEVSLVDYRGSSRIALLLDGREIDEKLIASPITFRATVKAPGLTPTADYHGVEQNTYLNRVIRAVKAAAVRASEALAEFCAGADLDERVRVPPERHRARDGDAFGRSSLRMKAAETILAGMELARSIGADPANSGPFMRAPIWQGQDGRWYSLFELQNEAAVNVMRPWTVTPPPGRVTILGDVPALRELRTALEPDTAVVRFEQSSRMRLRSGAALARRLASTPGTAALAIEAEGHRGAIAWGTSRSQLVILHAGCELETRSYRNQLVPCTIAVDDDAVVPSPEWADVRDLAGVPERDYGDWERAIARSMAHAAVGDAPPELVLGAGVIDPLGHLNFNRGAGYRLLVALVECLDPVELFGERLFERLHDARLWRCAGEPYPVSAAVLADRFPERIPYLPELPLSLPPLGEWRPALVDALAARAVGRLAGRDVYDATRELDQRRRDAARAARLAEIRKQPALPLKPLYGGHVLALHLEGTNGLLGIGRSPGLLLQVRIEGRPVRTFEWPGEPVPLYAIFDGTGELLDDAGAEIDADVVDALRRGANHSALELFHDIAETQPTALLTAANTAHAFHLALRASRLFSSIKTLDGESLTPGATDLLPHFRDAVRFPTVQGGDATVHDATGAAGVRVCRWSGEWLEAEEEAHELDRPILRVFDEGAHRVPLRELIEELAPLGVATDDVTADVAQLQLDRRIQRGLIPRPTLPGADPRVCRQISDLGEIPDALGPGEVALVPAPPSRLTIHRVGVRIAELEYDTVPPVHCAIEKPAHGNANPDELRHALERLGQDLLLYVASTGGIDEAPDWLFRTMRNALFDGSDFLTPIHGIPLFRTTTGSTVSWHALTEQQRLFSDVWYTDAESTAVPLHKKRLALRLDEPPPREAALKFVDASRELALDATARENQNRPKAESLTLGPGERAGAFAEVPFEHKQGSGVIAPLTARAAGLRGVHVYRNQRPLGFAEDPCSWPTVTIVDSSNVKPNRTWSAPELGDRSWKKLAKAIRKASDEAINKQIEAPSDALTSHWVGRYVETQKYADRELTVRGRLWLSGPPVPAAIKVELGLEEVLFEPYATVGERVPLPIGGWLMVHPPQALVPTRALNRIALGLYPALLRQAVVRAKADRGLVAAHAAYGLLHRFVSPELVDRIRFDCFQGEPLTAEALRALFASDEKLEVVAADQSTGQADRPLLKDDGGPLAQTIIELFGERCSWPAQEENEVELGISMAAPTAPGSRPAPPAAANLDPELELLARLNDRLIEVHPRGDKATAAIELRHARRPVAEYGLSRHVVAIAANSPAFQKLLMACAREDPALDAGIDLLVAHVMSVLNNALTDVTDACEQGALIELLDR